MLRVLKEDLMLYCPQVYNHNVSNIVIYDLVF